MKCLMKGDAAGLRGSNFKLIQPSRLKDILK